MRRPTPFLLSFAVLALAGSASADVVTTTDGLLLEGSALEQPGGWRVETADGTVVLTAKQVLKVERGPGPRAAFRDRAAALAANDAAGWYRLALDAEAQGLADVARAAYEKVVAVEPDHPAARRALRHERVGDAWLPEEQAKRQKGLVLYDGRWRLPAEVSRLVATAPSAPAATVPDATAPDAKGEATDETVRAWVRGLAAEGPVARAAERALDRVAPERALRAALSVLYEKDPAVRRVAARFLGRLGDQAALRPLILSAARDLDAGVRREATLAAASFGNDDTALPFVRALGATHPRLVANAAEAIATLGDTRAAPFLVKRLEGHGASARSFVAFTRQISYVKDYDVEIAQASNIANPIVDVIQEGVILDARVLDAHYETTWVESALVDALSRLVETPMRTREDALAWWLAHKDAWPTYPEAPKH